MGGTMRLGFLGPANEENSTAQPRRRKRYSERHRHRYEFNCEYEKR